MLSEAVTHWLEQTLQLSGFKAAPISGGANNLGVKIQAAKKCWFLKRYDTAHPLAQQKQHNEFQFSQAIYNAGINATPRPIAFNSLLNVSLFEYIDGTKVNYASPEAVRAAVNFIQAINDSPQRDSLSIASESANSLYGFVTIVSERLARLKQVQVDKPQLADALLLQLENITSRLEVTTAELPAHWHNPVAQDVLSPSDFGFHNALRHNNSFFFIDFEYAGMDTPWKLFSDFFSQPAVPVDINYAQTFLSLPLFKPLRTAPQDTLKVYELTLLKWCLIMLNEFLPAVQSRRMFSWNISCLNEKQTKLQQVQLAQLQKCNSYFKEIPLKVMSLDRVLREIT